MAASIRAEISGGRSLACGGREGLMAFVAVIGRACI
jgi:hypothetical protein